MSEDEDELCDKFRLEVMIFVDRQDLSTRLDETASRKGERKEEKRNVD